MVSSSESACLYAGSQGESQDKVSAINHVITSRFLFLRQVHHHLNLLDSRCQAMHLRHLARRERRRNQHLLMLERHAELSAQLNFSAQLRHLVNEIDDLGESNEFHVRRFNNVMAHTSAIVQLNTRLIQRNHYLQSRLNRIYLTLRPAVYFNRAARGLSDTTA